MYIYIYLYIYIYVYIHVYIYTFNTATCLPYISGIPLKCNVRYKYFYFGGELSSHPGT